MNKCESCGYVCEDEFSRCPQCGYEESVATEQSAVELEESTEQETAESTERQSNLYEYVSCGVPDEVDTSENKSLSQRKDLIKPIKVIAVCLGVLVLSFAGVYLARSLSDSSNSKENTALTENQDTSRKPSDNQQIEMKPTRYNMTGEFSDYQIMIDKNVYQIHMTVGEILDSGWIFTSGVTDGVLPAGEKAEILMKSADGAVMQITAVNFNNSSTSCRDCIVCEIKIELSDNAESDVSIISGLKLGSANIDSLEDVIGKSGDTVLAGRGYVLTYAESETRIAQFTFDKTTENLIGIRFCDSKKPSDYGEDDDWENAHQTALPYPTDPEVTPTSGIISVDGEVYRLPISVDVLISRGWSADFEGGDKKIPAGGRAYATFTRGSAVLTGVDVYNPTISEAYIGDCSVVAVSSSSAEGWVVFPLGIKAGISEAAFILSVEGMEYEFDDTYFDEYVFSDENYTFVVNIDSKTGKVIYVSSSYNY